MLSLSPYQSDGVRWLSDRPRAILADDMGLGKTAQAIAAVRQSGARSCLVVCPKSLIGQWHGELSQWDPSRSVAWHVTNYERVHHARATYDYVIVDESVKIKNPEAQRTANVLIAVLKAPRVVFLTGTPIRNHPKDLFTMAAAIDTRLLIARQLPLQSSLRKSYWRWVRRTFVVTPNMWGGYDIGDWLPGREEEVQAWLGQHMLRRTKALLKLPPLSREVVHIPYAPGQKEAVQAIQDSLLQVIQDDGTVEGQQLTNALQILIRLRQANVDPSMIPSPGGSGKLNWLKQWWTDYQEITPKVILFTSFARFAHRVGETLPHTSVYTGELSQSRREGVIAQFHEPGPRLMAMTAEAGAFGLNLQVADATIWSDLPWTPDTWEQGTARMHRRGQEKPCHEWILQHPESVDGIVYRILQRKNRLATRTLAAQKAVLAELKNQGGERHERESVRA